MEALESSFLHSSVVVSHQQLQFSKCPEVRAARPVIAQNVLLFARPSAKRETKRVVCTPFGFVPPGKWTNHKGRNRRFTNPDELEEQRKREEQERRWKTARGDDESSSDEEKPATKGDKSNSEDESDSESESDEDSDDVSSVSPPVQAVSGVITHLLCDVQCSDGYRILSVRCFSNEKQYGTNSL